MLPSTLALVDDDLEFSEFLAQDLRSRGVDVTGFANGSDFLADPGCFAFEFFVLDLSLPGVDGLELSRILRKRTEAGILVISGRNGPDVFASIVNAGADMYFSKPVSFQQVALGVLAVQRRSFAARKSLSAWKLDRRSRELVAPDGVKVALSESDLAVLECFLDAGGKPVPRDLIRTRLGQDATQGADNLLHATMYRLRRRIERATPLVVPLQSQHRVGYIFKGALVPA